MHLILIILRAKLIIISMCIFISPIISKKYLCVGAGAAGGCIKVILAVNAPRGVISDLDNPQ